MEKPTQNKDSHTISVPPPAIFLLLYGLAVGAEQLAPAPFTFAGDQWTGLALLFISFIFALPPVFQFISSGNSLSPNRSTESLVTSGFYRLTRNPMYLGAMLAFLGLTFLNQSFWVLIGTILIFLYLNNYIISREEAYMTKKYGKDYESFCRRVRRWL